MDIDVGLSTARILPSPDHGSLKQPKSRSISNNHSLPLKRFKKGTSKEPRSVNNPRWNLTEI